MKSPNEWKPWQQWCLLAVSFIIAAIGTPRDALAFVVIALLLMMGGIWSCVDWVRGRKPREIHDFEEGTSRHAKRPPVQ